jgi:hypothetical protein
VILQIFSLEALGKMWAISTQMTTIRGRMTDHEIYFKEKLQFLPPIIMFIQCLRMKHLLTEPLVS